MTNRLTLARRIYAIEMLIVFLLFLSSSCDPGHGQWRRLYFGMIHELPSGHLTSPWKILGNHNTASQSNFQ